MPDQQTVPERPPFVIERRGMAHGPTGIVNTIEYLSPGGLTQRGGARWVTSLDKAKKWRSRTEVLAAYALLTADASEERAIHIRCWQDVEREIRDPRNPLEKAARSYIEAMGTPEGEFRLGVVGLLHQFRKENPEYRLEPSPVAHLDIGLL